MNIKLNKLRNFTFKTQDNPPKKHDGLEELRRERENIQRRWERLGLLDGLTGHVDMNVAKLFEGQLSYSFSFKYDDENNYLGRYDDKPANIETLPKKGFGR